MTQFTKAGERKLSEAGSRVLSLVTDEGVNPDQAIAKVAADLGLPQPYLPLLVQGYNIARSAQQRYESDGILEKLADFPIARIENVESILYPDKPATLTDLHHKHAIDQSYFEPPAPPRAEPKPKREKAAWAPKPGPEVPTRIKLSSDRRTATSDISMAHHNYISALAEMARYFGQYSSPIRYETFKQAAAIRYGELGLEIARQVRDTLKDLGKTLKVAEKLDRRPFPPDSLPATQLDRAVKAAHRMYEHGELKAAAEAGLGELDRQQREPSILRDDALHLWNGDVTPHESKEAGLTSFLSGAAGGALASDIKDVGYKPTSDLVSKAKSDLETVPHMQRMQAANTDFTLRDLMSNDEVVSSYDPEHVAEAYNELMTTAPNSMGQPGIVRAMLRKRLSAGVMDPLDVDQLLGLEQRLLKNRQMTGMGDE